MRPRSRRTVLKFGSRLLTNGTTEVSQARLDAIAAAIGPTPNVVVVSSGAVAAGFRPLGLATPPTRIANRQAAAAVGQGRLMAHWSRAFRRVGRDVGQVLLTNDCLTDRKRYVAARQALAALLEAGIVPIVNENDTVAVDEIEVGDNDNLAAITAALIDAEVLALLTDVPGVMSSDPDVDPNASIVQRASSAEELRTLCFGKKAVESTGGMITKLEAAERAGRYGIPTVIADGRNPEVLRSLLRGEATGTLISPDPDPLSARAHWMAVQKGLQGSLMIDDGAVRALRSRASLLPRGIVGVEGHFRRGDLIAVVDERGLEIARGIVRFDDRDVERMIGMHTDEARKTLGDGFGDVVMRPDRMVVVRGTGIDS